MGGPLGLARRRIAREPVAVSHARHLASSRAPFQDDAVSGASRNVAADVVQQRVVEIRPGGGVSFDHAL